MFTYTCPLFCCKPIVKLILQNLKYFVTPFVFVLFQGLTSSTDGVSLLRGNETPPPSLESQSSSDLQLHASSSSGMAFGPPPPYEVCCFLYSTGSISITVICDIDFVGIHAHVSPNSQCVETSFTTHWRRASEDSQKDWFDPTPTHRNLWRMQEKQRVWWAIFSFLCYILITLNNCGGFYYYLIFTDVWYAWWSSWWEIPVTNRN